MDGFIYTIRTVALENNDPNKKISSDEIYVDLNGSAGPNQYGKDLFFFARAVDGEKGGVVLPQGYDKTNEEVNSKCLRDGYYCAEKIRRAGWQIDKSYPW